MFKRFTSGLVLSLFAATSLAAALPALPAPDVIASAVQQAMAPGASQQAATQLAAAPQAAASQQVATPQQAAAQQLMDDTVAVRRSGRSVIARATAYNSLGSQTDSTPHITATGTRTRPGVVALSRDLLRSFPYGSRVTIQDLSGRYNFGNSVYIVEDTMAARKTSSIDIWMPSYRQAIAFGAKQVRITAVR